MKDHLDAVAIRMKDHFVAVTNTNSFLYYHVLVDVKRHEQIDMLTTERTLIHNIHNDAHDDAIASLVDATPGLIHVLTGMVDMHPKHIQNTHPMCVSNSYPICI